MCYSLRHLLLILVFSLLVPVGTMAEEISDQLCAECHQDTGGEVAEVSAQNLVGSVHEDFSCTECHSDITELPHAEVLATPDCGSCHDEEADAYKQHGRGIVGISEFVPSCTNCHGSHQILPASDTNSMVYPANLPNTCGTCHENQEFLAQVDIRFKHPVTVYRSGVHGKTIAGGEGVAASCNDCHAAAGTPHSILPPGNVESTINFFNISQTCGNCHGTIEKEYEEGIHGKLLARGDVSAPTCVHCHGEHGILATDDPRSPVSPFRVAEATCTPCHDSANLNERYDVPTGKIQSYVDSYHGLKSRAGDTTVANCASCHGAHLILASTNPKSSVAPANLVNTCGNCHTGITAEKVAQIKIHETGVPVKTGWPYWITMTYKLLIVMIIGGMAFYCLLDWLRQVRNVLRKKQVPRMETDEVLQHAVLAISFTVLVVTGFSLRFYDAWWAKLMFGHEGGAAIRGLIHRGAAILMIIGAIWHLGYFLTAKGRVFLSDMAPNIDDAKQLWGMFMYNLSRTNQHPQMRRFSFYEKAEYWALIWGTVAMVMTGLSMWFQNSLVSVIGKQVFEVFWVIHYYEAWLAFLAILVWHTYGVLFNPHVYPMNPSWLNGKMPKEMFETEHPAAQLPGDVNKVKRWESERDV